MRSLSVVLGLLGLLTGVALAGEKAAEPTEPTEPTDNVTPPAATEGVAPPATPVDCSTLEGDAKTTCEASIEVDDKVRSKGKAGLKKSENNNMEQYVEEDE